MPLLPAERCLFPDDLLTVPPGDDPQGRGWWVLHTRPRAEKALARRLLGRGVPFFLPLYQRQWRRRGRALESHLPLFPGYVFLFGNLHGRLAALETNLVAHVLPVPDQERLRADLAQVHRLITSEAALAPEDRLVPGTEVRIICGPLEGLRGKILRHSRRLRFFIEVEFLQRAVSVEVENWMIEPVEPFRPSAPSRVAH